MKNARGFSLLAVCFLLMVSASSIWFFCHELQTKQLILSSHQKRSMAEKQQQENIKAWLAQGAHHSPDTMRCDTLHLSPHHQKWQCQDIYGFDIWIYVHKNQGNIESFQVWRP